MTGIDENAVDRVMNELIEAEGKAALAKFHSSRFEDRLERRIRAVSARPRRAAIFRAVPRPAWIPLAVLILIGGVAMALLLRRNPGVDGRTAIEAALRRMPVMLDIESAKKFRPVSGFASPPSSTVEKRIAAVLARSAEKPGAPDAPRRAEGFPPIKSLTKPMDLEELYGILVIDRSVERVLTAISPIAKEG